MNRPAISVVLPVLNERESLPQLHAELTATLADVGEPYEIVIVDDGSSDGSIEWSRELLQRDRNVVLVELRRRFGKAVALQAGLNHARGDVIITMDADLQDDPREIPRFLAALDEDCDLVSGWKENRQDPLSKTLPSKLFNRVTSWASGLNLRDFNCGFKAYRREVTANLDLYGELYRYIPVLVHAKGFRVTELPVTHRPRIHGRSKFGWKRFLRGPFDLFTTLFLCGFRMRPLHLFGPLGIGFGLLGFIINLYLAVLWMTGETIGNRPLLTLGTLMIIVGIQILIFGLLGEMITSATYRSTDVDNLIRRVSRGREETQPMARQVV